MQPEIRLKMHELSYVLRLIKQISEYFEKSPLEPGESVEALLVDVGNTTGVIPDWLDRYYRESTGGTVLEGSRLDINQIPVSIKCRDCGDTYYPEKENRYLCPVCGSKRGEMISGREFFIKKIIIRSDDDENDQNDHD